jgi:hypothetical protein
MRAKNLISVLAVVLLFSACSKVKDMDQRTEQMNNNTQELNDNSKDMAKDVKQTKVIAQETKQEVKNTGKSALRTEDSICKQLKLMRQDGAETKRDKKFERIDEMKSYTAKTLQAAIYHKAFEFQLWTGLCKDDLEKREIFFDEAVIDHMRRTAEYMEPLLDKNRKIKYNVGTTKKKYKNDVYNVMALAVTLHQVNSYQEDILKYMKEKNVNIEEVSMYTLIKDSLKASDAIKDGRKGVNDLRTYERTALDYESTMVNLLKFRYNALAAMTLGVVFPKDVNKLSFWDKIGIGWKRLWKKKWKSNFNSLNLIKQATINTWVKEANDTKSFMTSIGIKVKMVSSVKKLLQDIEVGNIKDNKCLACQSNNIEFKRQMSRLLGKTVK